MFKRQLIIGTLIVPVLILNGCKANEGLSDTSIEEKDIQQEQERQDVDIAYDFIMENIELSAAEGVNIEIQKSGNSIIIVYTYSPELTEVLKQQGLTDSELFDIANQIGGTSLDIQQWVKEYTGIKVDIETKVCDADGNLYIHIINKELVEMNSISPSSFELKEL